MMYGGYYRFVTDIFITQIKLEFKFIRDSLSTQEIRAKFTSVDHMQQRVSAKLYKFVPSHQTRDDQRERKEEDINKAMIKVLTTDI